MTQQYTPVSWQDETTSQQGTLINAERLNQMQTAHHYADGLEEVDTIPTADPGVAYHKIVYCTADNTLYRWDGEAWTADIDDPTRELLEEHLADHDNPHQVTKAQVGLGNCDNTSDADKPISTATQTALDTKLTQRYTTAVGREYVYAYTRTQQTAIEANQGMETLTIPIRDSEGAMHAQVPASPQATHVINYGWANTELDKKADKATTYTKSETDTLLGGKADTATTLAGYGITDAYTKTEADTLLGAKANDNAVVKLTGNQEIGGTKTFSSIIYHAQSGNQYDLVGIRTDMDITALTGTGYKNILKVQDKNAEVFTAISSRIYTDQSSKAFLTTLSAGNVGQTSEIATVATLDGYLPMVRTTGNQTLQAKKTFNELEAANLHGTLVGYMPAVNTGGYKKLLKIKVGVYRGVVLDVFTGGGNPNMTYKHVFVSRRQNPERAVILCNESWGYESIEYSMWALYNTDGSIDVYASESASQNTNIYVNSYRYGSGYSTAESYLSSIEMIPESDLVHLDALPAGCVQMVKTTNFMA